MSFTYSMARYASGKACPATCHPTVQVASKVASTLDKKREIAHEFIRIYLRHEPPLQFTVTGNQHIGEAVPVKAVVFQHADANAVQLVLGRDVDKCVAFLLVLEHMDAMPRGEWGTRPQRLLPQSGPIGLQRAVVSRQGLNAYE